MDSIKKIISESEVFYIYAGAGMSAESGIPTYRDTNGLWTDFPLLKEHNLNYYQFATPFFIEEHPKEAWEVHKKIIDIINNAEPHLGYMLLINWLKNNNKPYFVITSNIDSQFKKAGFAESNILEIHGSKAWLQCSIPCNDQIWEYQDFGTDFPICSICGSSARPNVVFFSDGTYLSNRKVEQSGNLELFTIKHKNKPSCVLEFGAGSGIPTIRTLSQKQATRLNARYIKINPEYDNNESIRTYYVKNTAKIFIEEYFKS